MFCLLTREAFAGDAGEGASTAEQCSQGWHVDVANNKALIRLTFKACFVSVKLAYCWF
jgi:hypothetical protein